MTGTALDFKKHCNIPFGAYVEAHEDYDRTHTMTERKNEIYALAQPPTSKEAINYYA
jgi:hypothetical protein